MDVRLPDGTLIQNVPDNITKDQLTQKLASNGYDVSKFMPQTPAQPQKATFKQDIQASIPGRVLQGARDPIDAAATLLPKGLQAITSLGGLTPNPVSDWLGSEASRVQNINKQNEQEYQQARQATGSTGADVSRFVGNVISPINAIPAARMATPANLTQKILQGAAMGGAGGLLSGDADVNSPDYWAEKGKSALLGTAIGGALPAVVQGVSNVIKPNVNEKVASLLRQGVTPTPGQILGGTAQKVEEKLQSVPILGEAISSAKNKSLAEFNKAALDKTLAPIGESVDDIGRAGVAQVKQKISDAYNSLLPKINFVPDEQFQQEYGNLQKMVTGLGPQEQGRFQSIMNDVMSKASPNGSMTGQTFKIAESKLSKEASNFSGSTDAYQRELGDALNEGLRIMRDTLPRVNPEYGDQLSKINQAFANYARIRQAASSTATGAREGVFTPAQLAQAVRSLDKSAGKGASATGSALMQDLAEQGTNVLGSKVPDSGTAGRLLTTGGLGAAAGATGTIIPAAAGLGVASLPYLGAGRNIAAKVLTQRPANAEKLARMLRKTSPYLAGAVPFALEQP